MSLKKLSLAAAISISIISTVGTAAYATGKDVAKSPNSDLPKVSQEKIIQLADAGRYTGGAAGYRVCPVTKPVCPVCPQPQARCPQPMPVCPCPPVQQPCPCPTGAAAPQEPCPAPCPDPCPAQCPAPCPTCIPIEQQLEGIPTGGAGGLNPPIFLYPQNFQPQSYQIRPLQLQQCPCPTGGAANPIILQPAQPLYPQMCPQQQGMSPVLMPMGLTGGAASAGSLNIECPVSVNCPNSETNSNYQQRQVYAFPSLGNESMAITEGERLVQIGGDEGNLIAGGTSDLKGSATGAAAPTDPNCPCPKCPSDKSILGAFTNMNSQTGCQVSARCGVGISRAEYDPNKCGQSVCLETSSSTEFCGVTYVPEEITGAAADIVGNAFPDVPPGYWARCDINRLASSLVTISFGRKVPSGYPFIKPLQ